MEHDIGCRVFAKQVQTWSFKTKSQGTFSKENQELTKVGKFFSSCELEKA